MLNIMFFQTSQEGGIVCLLFASFFIPKLVEVAITEPWALSASMV